MIVEFGDLDALLARAEEIKQPKRRENLLNFAEQARISRELVTLRRDAPMPVALKDMARAAPVAENLMGFLKAMEFNTLKRRWPSAMISTLMPMRPQRLWRQGGSAEKDAGNATGRAAGRRAGRPRYPPAEMPALDVSAYTCVTKPDELEDWVARATRGGVVAVDTETDGLNAMQCRLVGVCWPWHRAGVLRTGTRGR